MISAIRTIIGSIEMMAVQLCIYKNTICGIAAMLADITPVVFRGMVFTVIGNIMVSILINH